MRIHGLFWSAIKSCPPGTDLVGASLTNYKLGLFISSAIPASKFKPISTFLACFLVRKKGREKAVEALEVFRTLTSCLNCAKSLLS